MNYQQWIFTGLMTTTLALTGCGGADNVKPETGADQAPKPILEPKDKENLPWRYGQPNGEVKVIGAQTTEGVPEGAELSAEELAAEPNTPQNPDQGAQTFEPVVHFGYNEDVLDEKAMAVIEYYAKQLMAEPMKRVKLLGHTDERGTPEYNLALGERRAKAVKRAMMVFGVSPERIEVISYGEEKPIDEGHTEAAWAKNRRVEIDIY